MSIQTSFVAEVDGKSEIINIQTDADDPGIVLFMLSGKQVVASRHSIQSAIQASTAEYAKSVQQARAKNQ